MSTLTLFTNTGLPHSRPDRAPGDPYLHLQLIEGVHAVFAMPQVQEVYTLPAHRLTPMPNLPACILGLMHHRSDVVWVVDLATILGLGGLGVNYQHYNLVMVRSGELVLALAIQSILGFCWLTPEAIYPIHGQVSAALQPYLHGYAMREQEVLLVLNAEAILHSTALHTTP